MAAKDYKLAVSAITDTIYITKVSKRNSDVMTDDRAVVEKSNFIHCLLGWAKNQLPDGQNTLSITGGGKVIAEITLFNQQPDEPS